MPYVGQLPLNSGSAKPRDDEPELAALLKQHGLPHVSENKMCTTDAKYAYASVARYACDGRPMRTAAQQKRYNRAWAMTEAKLTPYMGNSRILTTAEVRAEIEEQTHPGFVQALNPKLEGTQHKKADVYAAREEEIEQDWNTRLKNGDYFPACSVTVKREPLPMSKIASGKRRTVIAFDAEAQIHLQRLTMDANKKWQRDPLKSMSALGWSPFSRGTHSLAGYLAQCPKLTKNKADCWDFDGAKWDAHMDYEALMRIAQLRFNMLRREDRTEENWIRLKTLYQGVARGLLIMPDGHVFLRGYTAGGGNPSGQPNTGHDNTLYAIFVMFYCFLTWCEENNITDPNVVWNENIRFISLGDDMTISIKKELTQRQSPFNGKYIMATAFEQLGIILETTSKESEDFAGHSFDQTWFLCRGMEYNSDWNIYVQTMDKGRMSSSILQRGSKRTPSEHLTRLAGVRTMTFGQPDFRNRVAAVIEDYIKAHDNDLKTLPEWEMAKQCVLTDNQLELLYTGHSTARIRNVSLSLSLDPSILKEVTVTAVKQPEVKTGILQSASHPITRIVKDYLCNCYTCARAYTTDQEYNCIDATFWLGSFDQCRHNTEEIVHGYRCPTYGKLTPIRDGAYFLQFEYVDPEAEAEIQIRHRTNAFPEEWLPEQLQAFAFLDKQWLAPSRDGSESKNRPSNWQTSQAKCRMTTKIDSKRSTLTTKSTRKALTFASANAAVSKQRQHGKPSMMRTQKSHQKEKRATVRRALSEPHLLMLRNHRVQQKPKKRAAQIHTKRAATRIAHQHSNTASSSARHARLRTPMPSPQARQQQRRFSLPPKPGGSTAASQIVANTFKTVRNQQARLKALQNLKPWERVDRAGHVWDKHIGEELGNTVWNEEKTKDAPVLAQTGTTALKAIGNLVSQAGSTFGLRGFNVQPAFQVHRPDFGQQSYELEMKRFKQARPMRSSSPIPLQELSSSAAESTVERFASYAPSTQLEQGVPRSTADVKLLDLYQAPKTFFTVHRTGALRPTLVKDHPVLNGPRMKQFHKHSRGSFLKHPHVSVTVEGCDYLGSMTISSTAAQPDTAIKGDKLMELMVHPLEVSTNTKWIKQAHAFQRLRQIAGLYQNYLMDIEVIIAPNVGTGASGSMRGFYEPDPQDKNTMTGDEAIENAAQAPGSPQATFYDWTTWRMPHKAQQRLYYMKPSGSDPRLIIQSVFTLLCVHPPMSNLTTTLVSATVGDVYLRWRCYLVQPQLDLSMAPGIGIMAASAATAVSQAAAQVSSASGGGGPMWLSNYDASITNVVTNTMVGDSDILAPEIAAIFASGGNTSAYTYDDPANGILSYQSIFNLNLFGDTASANVYSQGLVLQPGCYSLYITLNCLGTETREDKHVNGFMNPAYAAGKVAMPFAVFALNDNSWVRLPYMPGPTDAQPFGAVTMIHTSISETDTGEAEGNATYYAPSVTQGVCWECPNTPCLVITASNASFETRATDLTAAFYYNGWPDVFHHGNVVSGSAFNGKTNCPSMSWMLSKFALANLDGNLWSHDLTPEAWQYVSQLSSLAAHGFQCTGIPKGTLASTARRAFLLGIPAPAALGQFLLNKLPYKSEPSWLRAPEMRDGDCISEEKADSVDQRSTRRGYGLLCTAQATLGDAQGDQDQQADRQARTGRTVDQTQRISSLEGLSDGKERGAERQQQAGLQHDDSKDRKRSGDGDGKQTAKQDPQGLGGLRRDDRRPADFESGRERKKGSFEGSPPPRIERPQGSTNTGEDADQESPVFVGDHFSNPSTPAAATSKLYGAQVAARR